MRRIVAIGAVAALLLGLFGIAAIQRVIVIAGWGGRGGIELGVPKDAGPPLPKAIDRLGKRSDQQK